jgi:hypothetical protein
MYIYKSSYLPRPITIAKRVDGYDKCAAELSSLRVGVSALVDIENFVGSWLLYAS